MARIVWYNGVYSPLETASVPAADHAHLYGDGIFEGIRIYDRKVFKLDEHLRRFFDGARFLGYDMVLTLDGLKQIILEVCTKAEEANGYIRLNLTRGTGLGLDPRAVHGAPNVMVMISNLNLYTEEAHQKGLDAITTGYKVNDGDNLDPRLKCIGRYASNIMAKAEANRAGVGEGLMLNRQGYVAECTGDNIFVIRDGVLRTPHTSSGILQGITRDTVIELGRSMGIPVVEDLMTRYDVIAADEAFLTGTAAEVIPLVKLDDRLIGSGRPGEMTKRVIAAFREHTLHGTPF